MKNKRIDRNCGACGTPMSVNRFGNPDCPKCYTENFCGLGNYQGIEKSKKKTVQEQIPVTVDPNAEAFADE